MKFTIYIVAVVLLLFSGVCSADVTTGLVSRWSLDNTLEDQGTLANDGILTGLANWQTGKFNQAMGFDGSSYVSIPNESDYDFTGPMTISAWFIADFSTPDQTIISKGTSFHIYRNFESNTLIFLCEGVGRAAVGTVSINDNNWHHVAGVYDGSSISIYIDGQLDFSRSASGAILTNNYALRIGSNAELGNTNWQGAIDEVRVYDRALSAAEVAEIGGGFLAKAISPIDDSIISAENVIINWLPGYQSQSHDVYFGTEAAEVENATTASPEYKGNQILTNTTYPLGDLESDKTYYWRIDEIQTSTTYKGDVWSFSTQDSSLRGWWKFDETTGEIAADSSAYSCDAVLINEPQWDEGQIDGCLYFNSAGWNQERCEVNNEANFDITDQITIAGWIKVWGWARWGSNDTIICKGNDSWKLYRDGSNDYHGPLTFTLSGVSPSGGVSVYGIEDENTWNHIGAVYDGTKMCLYVDGILKSSVAASGNINTNNAKVSIATNIESLDHQYKGRIDDLRVYDRALSIVEIAHLAQAYYVNAFNPIPVDGQTGLDKNLAQIQWSASIFEDSHNVYFGTDASAVENATIISDEFQASVPNDVNYFDLPALETGQTYYWRVDEIYSEQELKGDIWSFTVLPANAWNPSPVVNALVESDRTLVWSEGEFGGSYDIYFGTDYTEVENADHNSPAYKGNQPIGANSYDPGPLEPGKKYYWRIEQVNN
ncbi:MAG: LamG domain-containing protein [Planctomycetes bacterium]|nr:LamG domain-containing protein [Planctomycetota bacterium]